MDCARQLASCAECDISQAPSRLTEWEEKKNPPKKRSAYTQIRIAFYTML